MFDILNEYSQSLKDTIYVEITRENLNGYPYFETQLSENLFVATPGNTNIDRFTQQAVEKYTPVFEYFVVNGVMHSLETAADRGLDFQDLSTDITRRGARAWLRCQYERIGEHRSDEDKYKNIFKDADDDLGRAELTPMWIYQAWSGEVQLYTNFLRAARQASGQTDDQRQEMLRRFQAQHEKNQQTEMQKSVEDRTNYNKQKFDKLVKDAIHTLNAVAEAGAQEHWTFDRDRTWRNGTWKMFRFSNGNWVDEIKNIEDSLDYTGLDDGERAKAILRDRLLKERIMTNYTPVAVDKDDEELDELGEQARRDALEVANFLAHQPVGLTGDEVESEALPSAAEAMDTDATLLTKGAVVWSKARKETGRVVAVGQRTGSSGRSVYDDVVVEFAGNRIVSVLPESVSVLLGAAA